MTGEERHTTNMNDTDPIAPTSGSPICTRPTAGASGEMRNAPLDTSDTRWAKRNSVLCKLEELAQFAFIDGDEELHNAYNEAYGMARYVWLGQKYPKLASGALSCGGQASPE